MPNVGPVSWFGTLSGIGSAGDPMGTETKRARVRTTPWAESQHVQDFFTIGRLP